MHDPMTVAFEIRYPWYEHRPGHRDWPDGYRRSFITIWHVDPETDSSDDSCGWHCPPASENDRKAIQRLAKDLSFDRPANSISFEWLLIDRIGFWVGKRPKPRHFHRWLQQQSFPGSWSDKQWYTDENNYEVARIAWRIYAGLIRPWYRRPRWHVWHWRIQIHPVQKSKRWAFSRCAKCGGRFAYGEAPVSGQWNGPRPRWFIGEPNVWHVDCDASGSLTACSADQTEPPNPTQDPK